MQNEVFEVAISYNIEREKAYFLSLLNIYRYSKNQEIKKWYQCEEVEHYQEEDYPIK
jgi:hypothetical protein